MYRWPILFCLFFVFLASNTFCEPFSLEKIEHTISESEIITRLNTRGENTGRVIAVTFVVLIEIPGIDNNTWVDVFLVLGTDYKFSYGPFIAHDNWVRRSFYVTDKGLVLEFSAVPAHRDSGRTNRIDSPAGKKLVIFMAKSK